MQAIEIPLPSGHVALVDAADAPLLEGFRWRLVMLGRRPYRKPYAGARGSNDRTILMHRLLMCPESNVFVDHINGDGLDNRRSNLRACGHIQNMQNQHAIKGAVRFKGVCRCGSNSKPFRVSITVNRKRIALGHYVTAEEAAAAYDSAAVKYFGQFVKTNQQLGLLSRAEISVEQDEWLPPKRVNSE